MRAASAAIAFEEAGDQALKGKQAPVAGVSGPAGRRPARRPGSLGPARAAVRRPRRGAPPAQGPDRARPAATGGSRLVSITGPGGHRQEPARLGAREVHRRDQRRRSTGIAAARPSYGEGITFWALGEMVRRRAAPGRGRRRGDDPRADRRDGRRVRPRRGRPALGRARAPDPARPGARPGRRPRRPVRRLADLLRADRRPGHDRAAVRGPPVGRHRPARLHRVPARVVADVADPRRRPSPGRSSSTAGPTGAPTSRNLTRLALEPLTDEAMRELLDGFVPGLPEARRRRDPGPRRRDARCTRSRPSGRSSPTGGSSARATTYRPVGELGELAIPETLRSPDRLAPRCPRSGRPEPRRRRGGPRPVVHAWPASAAISGHDRPSSSRGSGPSSGASSSRSRPTRARPSAASTASSSR